MAGGGTITTTAATTTTAVITTTAATTSAASSVADMADKAEQKRTQTTQGEDKPGQEADTLGWGELRTSGAPKRPPKSRRPEYPPDDDEADSANTNGTTAGSRNDDILDTYRDALTCFACSRR
ncbi:hypothetical protein PTSG_02191 [Salpingoeca rosetta]|uniref:Uncharacterized protein n=1 Tax=Salpingoeca rosetta (strain ATCC 50818 / BSB-021) TaxID=946362 RepID=F2U1H1_SALR5|nr:uncharacterized protein PTSG_02191 [Salpingoeca rosetta]EGD81473.1 hypothetical protein PTSG_02191 [Salpingoeca rosetta]|eukprot:XP_004996677.1 hypothetical protein PTSG_02191 [Salpingoeca rosetta]